MVLHSVEIRYGGVRSSIIGGRATPFARYQLIVLGQRQAPSCSPAYVLPRTAYIVGRLTRRVLAAALAEPPLSMKSLNASTFYCKSAGGPPPVLPAAAARSTLALIRSRMVSISHSARERSMWSMILDVRYTPEADISSLWNKVPVRSGSRYGRTQADSITSENYQEEAPSKRM